MSAAAQLRARIEGELAHRIPSALTPHERLERPVAPTGIRAVDALLEGGFPVGAITEIVGSLSSGRSSYAQAFVAQRTREGQVCAWVDVADCLDPESAAANGVDLDRLLWVRCSPGTQAPEPPVPVPASSQQATPIAAPAEGSGMAGGGGSPHPRSEGRGLSTAISSFLESELPVRNLPPRRRDKSIGTPGVANRSIAPEQTAKANATDQPRRTEQVATDRLPARRGAYVLDQRARAQGQVDTGQQSYAPRCTEPQPRRQPQLITVQPSAPVLPIAPPLPAPRLARLDTKPWKRLDQALRSTDLLLQTGGFAALVLDLGTIAPAEVSRIPLATWFRFRAAADRTRTTIILLTQHPCAQTSAELVLRTAVQMPEAGTVLTGLAYSVELVRQRFQPANPAHQPQRVLTLRKPPQRASSTTWQAACSWTGGR